MILTDCFLTRVKKMRLSKRHHEARSRAHLQNLAFQLCWRSTCLSNALPLKAVKKRALKTLGSSVGLAPPGGVTPQKDTCKALKLAAMD